MEAIDNKYLIVIKSDGTIDAITMKEMCLKDKFKINEIIAKGWTIILKNKRNDNEYCIGNKTMNENNSMLIFPVTFSSFEQASISLELFYYYSQDDRNCFNFYDVETDELNYSLKEKTREKLEQEKNRLKEKKILEDLSSKALILVYPDGKVESILEQMELDEDDNFDLYYYTELYKKSKRLRQALPDFVPYTREIEDTNHNKIDNDLIHQKVAIFFNQDTGKEFNLRTSSLSLFNVLLPKNYGSILQTEKLEEIFKKYPEHRMLLNMWNDIEKRCTSTYVSDVLEDLAIKKELIMKEGK